MHVLCCCAGLPRFGFQYSFRVSIRAAKPSWTQAFKILDLKTEMSTGEKSKGLDAGKDKHPVESWSQAMRKRALRFRDISAARVSNQSMVPRNLSMSVEQRLQKLSNGSHGNNKPCNTQILASRKEKMKHEGKTANFSQVRWRQEMGLSVRNRYT